MTQDKREAAYEKALEIASDGELAPFRAIAVAVDLGYDAATADLQRQVEAMREALGEMDIRFSLADNGICTVCRYGHRLYDLKGNVGQCENEQCLSRRVTAALALTTPTNAETEGKP